MSIDYKKERINRRKATTIDNKEQLKKGYYNSSIPLFDLAVRCLSNIYGYLIRACRTS
ncbi:MAG: hypothetical protein M3115_03025 [Thermoproteota archaeon]|nr:hypothetical protein [Thermoproteota archaeon]